MISQLHDLPIEQLKLDSMLKTVQGTVSPSKHGKHCFQRLQYL